MTIPRPRLTVRRLMIAVAVSAILLGIFVEGSRRRSRFEALVNKHQGECMKYFVLFPGPNSEHQRRSMQEYAAKVGEIVDYHVKMRDKYVRTYNYPWLPVAPDPPEPKSPEPFDHR